MYIVENCAKCYYSIPYAGLFINITSDAPPAIKNISIINNVAPTFECLVLSITSDSLTINCFILLIFVRIV